MAKEDLNLEGVEEVLNPSEYDAPGIYKPEYGGIDLLTYGMGAKAALGTYGLYHALKNVPGGYGKVLADNMHNYLEDASGHFYRPPSPTELKIEKMTGVPVHKVKLAAKEFTKGTWRIAKMFGNPVSSTAYKSTGVAPFVVDMFKEGEKEIVRIAKQYVEQPKGNNISFQDAKNQIRNIEKQLHFKVTSDYSNAYMYKTYPKNPVEKYASKYVTSGSQGDFIKTMGDKETARAVIGKQGVGLKGTKLMKYKNVNFSDVARGAQFDKDFYRTMRLLRNFKGDATFAAEFVRSNMYKSNAMPLNNGKMIFSLSPSIRPNYDWGGFNAVGIWDPEKPDRIKIAATDKRDLLGHTPGRARTTVNYVQTKDIEIKDLKKTFEPKVVEPTGPRGPYETRTPKEIRLENAKKLRLNQGKIGQNIGNEVIAPHERNVQKQLKTIKNPKLWKSPSGKKVMKKLLRQGLTRGGIASGAAALAALAFMQFGKDED